MLRWHKLLLLASARGALGGSVRGLLCRTLLLGLAVCGCALRGPVRAPREASDVCGGGPSAIEVEFVAFRGELLARATCEWFAGDQTTVRFIRSQPGQAAPPPQTLRLSIVLSGTDEAELRVIEPSRVGNLTRRVRLSSGLDEAGAEMVAQAVHSLAQAVLWAPRRYGDLSQSARAAPVVQDPAPPPPARLDRVREHHDQPSPSPRPRIEASAGYHWLHRGAEPATHGLSLRLDYLPWLLASKGRARRWWAGGFVAANVFSARPVPKEVLMLGLRGAALSSGVTATLRSGEEARWGARASLGIGAELVQPLATPVESARARVLAGRTEPRAYLDSQLALQGHARGLEFGAAGLLHVQFKTPHYDVLEAGRARTLARAHRLQAGILLSVAHSW